MKPLNCEEFRRTLGRALEQGEAAPRLEGHEHLLTCRACRALLEGEAALDELLAAWPQVSLPLDLARRVLARLAPARADARLDALLDLVPAPQAPAHLARRVLESLARERRAWRRSRSSPRRPVLVAAAVMVLLSGGALLFRYLGGDSSIEPELLEALDALENWDVVTSEDLDLLLAELDPVDWALLELGEEGG